MGIWSELVVNQIAQKYNITRKKWKEEIATNQNPKKNPTSSKPKNS